MEGRSPRHRASEDKTGRIGVWPPMDEEANNLQLIALRSKLHPGVTIVSFCESGLVAVEKPRGILSHPNGKIADHRAIIFAPYDNARRAYVPVPGDRSPPIYLVNRLDSATGGLILLATSAATAAKAREAFRRREVQKTYYAVVFGGHNFRGGRWRDRIRTERRENRLRTDGGSGAAMEALCDAMLVEQRDFGGIDLAILELHPITGLTHQLRYQCASRSMAVVGDRTYGNFHLNRRVAKELAVKGLQLHSAEIAFPSGTFIDGRQFHARSTELDAFVDWRRFYDKFFDS